MVQIESYIDKLLSVNDMSKSSLTRCIPEADLEEVIAKCREILLAQPTLIQLEAPVNICGDIHGQFVDLIRVFNRCGYPPNANYLFLGDYVDRGRQQLETICLLIGYKVLYPDSFFLLRGNHECHSINKVYGFYEECKRRYSVKIWECFQAMFNCLPFCALVSGRIFCMHGGLSPDLKSWDQLYKIKRPLDPPNRSIPMDLLWSDPEPNFSGWGPNTRGVSYIFGEDVVDYFCDSMDIDLIARGHQVVQDGYEFFANRKLVTLFTAPKYCGEFDNNSAVMLVQPNLECAFEFIKPSSINIKVRVKGKRKRSSKEE